MRINLTFGLCKAVIREHDTNAVTVVELGLLRRIFSGFRGVMTFGSTPIGGTQLRNSAWGGTPPCHRGLEYSTAALQKYLAEDMNK